MAYLSLLLYNIIEGETWNFLFFIGSPNSRANVSLLNYFTVIVMVKKQDIKFWIFGGSYRMSFMWQNHLTGAALNSVDVNTNFACCCWFKLHDHNCSVVCFAQYFTFLFSHHVIGPLLFDHYVDFKIFGFPLVINVYSHILSYCHEGQIKEKSVVWSKYYDLYIMKILISCIFFSNDVKLGCIITDALHCLTLLQ